MADAKPVLYGVDLSNAVDPRDEDQTIEMCCVSHARSVAAMAMLLTSYRTIKVVTITIEDFEVLRDVAKN